MRKTVSSGSVAAAVALILSLHVSTANAQASTHIELQAQPLSEAIRAVARQASVNILVDPRLVEGRQAPAIKSQSSVGDALSMLLEGTGLTPKFVDDKTITLVPERISGKSNPGSTQRMSLASLSDDPSVANAPQGDAVELESVQVTRAAIPEVLVENSRILNMDIKRSRDDAQPYVIFEREQIQQATATNLEQFLRDRLPMNAAGVEGAQVATAFGAKSTINLRGLGANQTLILIDGRRVVSGGSFGGSPDQPDLNGIPLSAVERIEVLPGSASGIYGGGATGGVINIILRRDYVGSEMKLTYSNSFDGGVAGRRMEFSSGFSLEEGRTSVLVTSSLSDQDRLQLKSRSHLIERAYDIVRANHPLYLQSGSPVLGATSNVRSLTGDDLELKAEFGGGSLNSPITTIPRGFAGVGTDGVDGLIANAGSYNTSYADTQQYLSGSSTLALGQQNAAVATTLRRRFSPNVQAFLDASFSEVETVAPNLIYAGSSLVPYRISAAAQNNPFAMDILVSAPINSGSFGDLTTERRQLRGAAGVIVSLPGQWQGALDYTWGRSRFQYHARTVLSTTQGDELIANGAIDLLRDFDLYPVDLVPYLDSRQSKIEPQVTTSQNVSLRLSGPTFSAPGGPVTVSSLLEYRDEVLDDVLQPGVGYAFLYPRKSQSVSSAYVEARVPLVSTKSRTMWAKDLELQLAIRGDLYRTIGTTPYVMLTPDGAPPQIGKTRNKVDSLNPTLAVRYQPVSDVAIRVSYATGFLAPDVSQLASNPYSSGVTLIDPRRGNSSVTIPGEAIMVGGNATLGPEESESWAAGVIFTPHGLPGLRVSLDYLNVTKTDNIAMYPTGMQGVVDDEVALPGRIRRGANLPGDPASWAGPITALDYTLFNVARAKIEAVDLQIDYSWTTHLGDFSALAVASKQLHYKTQSLDSLPVVESVGKTYLNPRKLAGNAELRWARGAWNAAWTARYHDSYSAATSTTFNSAVIEVLQANGGRVSSQTYHDMSLRYQPGVTSSPSLARVLAETEVHLNVRNVFDKTPPFDAYAFDSGRIYYSPLGDGLQRSYQLSVKKRF